MTVPKQHHFVPRWYLQGFAKSDAAPLFIFDRHTGTFRKQKAKKIMSIRNYYCQKWAPPGKDPYILEHAFARDLEPAAKKVLGKLINAPETITDEDTAALTIYIEFQRTRVPKHAAMAGEMFLRLASSQLPAEIFQAFAEGKIRLSDGFRFDAMKTMVGAFTPFFRRMEWCLIKACSGSSFVTSDNPVSFFNTAVIPPYEAPPFHMGTAVFFPINRENLLIMRHAEYKPGMNPLEVIRNPDDREGGIVLHRGDMFNDMEVNRHNWMMLDLSDRALIGDRKETLSRAIKYHHQ